MVVRSVEMSAGYPRIAQRAAARRRAGMLNAPSKPQRELVTLDEWNRIFAECNRKNPEGFLVHRNGWQLRDYLQFMCYTGARRNSAA